MEVPFLRLGVDDLGVVRIEDAREPVPSLDVGPVAVEDAFLGERPAGADPVQVVLQASADPIGDRLVEVDPVELAGGEAIQVLPALGAVEALVDASIGAEDQALGAARIDLERVKVGVDFSGAVLAERLAAVFRDVEGEAENVDALGVLGVHADLREVEGPRVQLAAAAPALSAVVRAEDAAHLARDVVDPAGSALARLDDGVDDLRIPAVDREADPAGRAGKARRKLRPGRPSVGRLENAAEVPAVGRVGTRGKGPGLTLPGIERGVERVGAGGIQDDVAAAHPIRIGRRGLQGGAPGLAAVARDVEAPLSAPRPEVAERRDPGDVRVRGVDHDAGDRARALQPDVLPGLAAVLGEVDAVAPGRAVAIVALAAADPDRLRIRRRHGDGADRSDRFFLEDPGEGPAVVGRLRDAAAREPHVEDVGVRGIEGDLGDAPAHHRRPDRAGLQGLQAGLVEARGGGRGRCGRLLGHGEDDGGEQAQHRQDDPPHQCSFRKTGERISAARRDSAGSGTKISIGG